MFIEGIRLNVLRKGDDSSYYLSKVIEDNIQALNNILEQLKLINNLEKSSNLQLTTKTEGGHSEL